MGSKKCDTTPTPPFLVALSAIVCSGRCEHVSDVEAVPCFLVQDLRVLGGLASEVITIEDGVVDPRVAGVRAGAHRDDFAVLHDLVELRDVVVCHPDDDPPGDGSRQVFIPVDSGVKLGRLDERVPDCLVGARVDVLRYRVVVVPVPESYSDPGDHEDHANGHK